MYSCIECIETIKGKKINRISLSNNAFYLTLTVALRTTKKKRLESMSSCNYLFSEIFLIRFSTLKLQEHK